MGRQPARGTFCPQITLAMARHRGTVTAWTGPGGPDRSESTFAERRLPVHDAFGVEELQPENDFSRVKPGRSGRRFPVNALTQRRRQGPAPPAGAVRSARRTHAQGPGLLDTDPPAPWLWGSGVQSEQTERPRRQSPPGAAPAPHSRGSGQIELLTTLDVVHQVPAVEVLHHEEEVFLGTETTARPSVSSGKQRTRPLLFTWI